MRDIFTIMLILSIVGVIFSIGAIIFSVITKRPQTVYIRSSVGSLILFILSTIVLLTI